MANDLSGVAVGLFLDQGIDQIYGVEEARLLPPIDQGGPERDGNVGLAGAGSAYQNEVVRLVSELPCAEGLDLGPG